MSLIGFVTESENEYVYDQAGWDALIEHHLCGDWELLVWGSSTDEPCEDSVVSDASKLQRSAMQEEETIEDALSVMLEKEPLYDLKHDTILVYHSGADCFWLWQKCFNSETVDGMYSFWSGD
jgi:hypothetical protein